VAAGAGGQVHGYNARPSRKSTAPAPDLRLGERGAVAGSRPGDGFPYSGGMQRSGTFAWWPS